MATAQPGTMDEVMLTQVGMLREQMASVPMPGDEPPAAQAATPPVPGLLYGRMMGRGSHFQLGG